MKSTDAISFLKNWKPNLEAETDSASTETLYHLLDERKSNEFIHFFTCSKDIFEISVKPEDLKAKLHKSKSNLFVYFLGDGCSNNQLQECCQDVHKYICKEKDHLALAFKSALEIFKNFSESIKKTNTY